MFARISLDLLEYIQSFAGFPDLRLNKVTNSRMSLLNERYALAAFPHGPSLASHRLAGEKKHWWPAFERWLKERQGDTIEDNFDIHREFAAYAPKNIGRFLAESRQFSSWLKVWIGYRILQIYRTDEDVIAKYVRKRVATYFTDEYRRVDIDPRIWFGSKHCKYSLWKDSMPKVLEDALLDRFTELSNQGKLESVSIVGRVEAELPDNWARSLVEALTARHITVICVSVDLASLSHPEYVKKY